MDDEKCYQPGCKLAERLSEADPKLAVEILHDVLPKGIDYEGEEVSFEAYLVSRFPGEPETRAKSAQSTDNGKNLKLLREYVDWHNAKMTIEVQRKVNGGSRYEHIAGPDCVHEGGYSGHAISADEMKYCTTIQCIVPYINQNREPFNDPGPELDDEEASTIFRASVIDADRGKTIAVSFLRAMAVTRSTHSNLVVSILASHRFTHIVSKYTDVFPDYDATRQT
jgi:hypothetical protein